MQNERRRAVVIAHLENVMTKAARAVESGWIDQQCSPIGPRRHCAAVRNRVRAERGTGRCTAAIIGRRHLLHVDALADEYFATRAVAGWASVLGATPCNDNAGHA